MDNNNIIVIYNDPTNKVKITLYPDDQDSRKYNYKVDSPTNLRPFFETYLAKREGYYKIYLENNNYSLICNFSIVKNPNIKGGGVRGLVMSMVLHPLIKKIYSDLPKANINGDEIWENKIKPEIRKNYELIDGKQSVEKEVSTISHLINRTEFEGNYDDYYVDQLIKDLNHDCNEFIKKINDIKDLSSLQSVIEKIFNFSVKYEGGFHSFRNKYLIFLQNPNASNVKPRKEWEELGRTIKKGSDPIILFTYDSNTKKSSLTANNYDISSTEEIDKSNFTNQPKISNKVSSFKDVLSILSNSLGIKPSDSSSTMLSSCINKIIKDNGIKDNISFICKNLILSKLIETGKLKWGSNNVLDVSSELNKLDLSERHVLTALSNITNVAAYIYRNIIKIMGDKILKENNSSDTITMKDTIEFLGLEDYIKQMISNKKEKENQIQEAVNYFLNYGIH